MNITGRYSFSFSSWVHHSYNVSPEGLGLYRIFTAFFLLLFFLPSPSIYHFMGTLPSDFYVPPPGPMTLFSEFPPELVLLIFHYTLCVALVCLGMGYKTTISSVITSILLLVINGFINSLGKIDHTFLVVMVPFVMAFSNWGKAYSVDSLFNTSAKKQVYSWPLTLLALIIGFMMFTAGFPKILGGWLDPFTQATEGHYLRQFIVRGRQDLLAPYAHSIPSIGWEIVDYGTVIFEVFFLMAVVNSRTTKFFVALAVFFHFGIMLLLNISFLPNFLGYAAFLNWQYIDRRLKRTFISHRWAPPVILGIVITSIFVLSQLLDNYFPMLTMDWGWAGIMMVAVALPFAGWQLVTEVQKIFSGKVIR